MLLSYVDIRKKSSQSHYSQVLVYIRILFHTSTCLDIMKLALTTTSSSDHLSLITSLGRPTREPIKQCYFTLAK